MKFRKHRKKEKPAACGCTAQQACMTHGTWDEELLAKMANAIMAERKLINIDDLIFMIFKMEDVRRSRAEQ